MKEETPPGSDPWFFLAPWIGHLLGEKGIFHLFRLKKELARIEEANVQLEKENAKTEGGRGAPQHEKRTIEEIARRELGMVQGRGDRLSVRAPGQWEGVSP